MDAPDQRSRHHAGSSEALEVVVGRIGKAVGLAGEVSVEVRTDDPDRRFALGARLSTDPTERGPLTVRTARWGSGRLHLSFEEAPDRTAVEALRNTVLSVAVDPLQRPEDPEEFYDHQLVGLSAVTGEGAAVGEVTAVLHLPVQDTLVIRRPDGSEALVPFVAEFVPEVDLDQRLVRLTPPPGLLDESADGSQQES